MSLKLGKSLAIFFAALIPVLAFNASASTFTDTSPVSGTLPSSVSTIGGVVLDLYGLNGTHVVSQLSATSLFVGYSYTNEFVVGVQSGFSSSIVNQLGGGLSSMAVRFTLSDGDSAADNFDAGSDLTLKVNGVGLGYWSAVSTQTTDSSGNAISSTHFGFADGALDTGWFSTTDSSILSSFYGTLNSGTVSYSVYDVDPGDNYYDFQQGVASSMQNVNTPPTVSSVPEPETYALFAAGLGLMGWSRRRSASRAARA